MKRRAKSKEIRRTTLVALGASSITLFLPLILSTAYLNMGQSGCGGTGGTGGTTVVPAGRIPGTYGVDDNGAATYDVAIDVPDGRNGLQPSLSLHYSSQGDNGVLGVGWSLAGTSSIHRCNQTYAHDGQPRGIQWNDVSDAYCLDGQRLEYVGIGLAPGGGSSSARYKVINNGRDRVQNYVEYGRLVFHVTQPDGTQLWYGGTDQSEVKTTGPGTPATFGWMLRKIEDLYGNTIDFQYASDGRLTRVLYGGNPVAGVNPSRVVYLRYEDRTDPLIRSVSSRAYPTITKRLSRVEVLANASLVRAYNFEYDESAATGRSLLRSLEMCAGGECQTPTKFNWAEAESKNRSTGIAQTLISDAPPGDPRVFGDFDGDGKTELMQPGVCSGGREFVIRDWDPPTSPAFVPNGGIYVNTPELPRTLCTGHAVNGQEMLYPFDHDHDGFVSAINANATWDYIPSHGVVTVVSTFEFIGGAEAPTDIVYTASGPTAEHVCWPSGVLLSGDLNGNGQVDLFTPCYTVPTVANETRYLQISCGTPSGSIPLDACVVTDVTTINGQNREADKTLALLDVDGDGVVEPTRSINGERVLITDPSTGLGAGHYLSRVMADVNNDGLLDNFDFEREKIDLAGGTTEQTLNLPGFGAPVFPSALRFADLDRDGMTDMVYLHPNTASHQIVIYWGTPNSDTPFHIDDKTLVDTVVCDKTGFDTPIDCSDCPRCDSRCGCPQAIVNDFTHHVQLVDMDGDGNLELTYRTVGDLNAIFVVEFNADPVDMIEWVEDGAREPKFFYGNTKNGGAFYTAETDCLYHQTCGVMDMEVVVYVLENTTGISASYGYKDARFDRQGAGFLGFAEVSSELTIDDAVITTTRRYDLDSPGTGNNWHTYPYHGLPIYESTHVRDTIEGTTDLTTTTTTYEIVALPNGGSLTVPDLTETKNWRFCYLACPSTGILLERTTVDYGYDGYGSVATIAESWYESPEFVHTTITNENIVTLDQYIVGRPTFVYESHTDFVHPTTTRSRELRYDARGGLERIIYEPLSQSERLDVSVVRDELGLVRTRSQTYLLNTTRSRSYDTYDSNRIRPVTITEGGLTHTFAYDDGLDAVTKYVDPASVTYDYEYDGFGRQTRMLINGQEDSSTTYTRPLDRPKEEMWVSTIYRNRPAIETRYDHLGRPEILRTKAFNGEWTRVSRMFNQMGLVTMETVPHSEAVPGATTYTYDASGRTTRVTAPDGKITTYNYDPAQSSVTITPPGQAARTMKYDGRGRLVQSSDAVSGTTMTYDYAAESRLVRIQDNRGNIWTFEHDRFGRVIESVDPDRGLHKYKYNGFGDLIYEEDGQQRDIYHYYDDLGRPNISVDYEVAGSSNAYTLYHYDDPTRNAEGRLHRIERVGDNTQIDIKYNDAGLTEWVNKTIDGKGYKTSYAYDASERPSRIDYPTIDGKSMAVYLDYTAENHLEVVRDATVSREYWRLQETDAWGRPTNIYVPGAQHVRSYDPVSGRLDSSAVAASGGGAYEHDYRYNNQGSVWQKERLGTSPRYEDYTYDGLGRLDSWELRPPVGNSQLHDYQYDALGNITQNAFGILEYDKIGNAGPHAVTAAAGTSYAYDVNGQRTQATGVEQWKATYTARGLPRVITDLNDNPLVEYAYDPLGQKVKRTAHAPNETSIFVDDLVEQHLTADGDFLVFRVHALGEEVARVVYRDGQAVPTVLGVANDELGSSTTFIDEATGIATTSHRDPWGNLIDENGNQVAWTDPVPSERSNFTGHRYTDLGMIDMGGRVYDPRTSQFLTGDPVVLAATATAQGFNPYAYVLNQPTRFTDPSGFVLCDGRCIEVEGGGGGGGAGGGYPLGSRLRTKEERKQARRARRARRAGRLGRPHRDARRAVRRATRRGHQPYPSAATRDQTTTWQNVFQGSNGSIFSNYTAAPTPDAYGGREPFAALDLVVDVGFIGYDLYSIYADNIAGDKGNLSINLQALALDVGGALLPFVTGLGAAARTTMQVGRAAENVATAGKTVLGRYPAYIDKAAELNARRFNVPTEVWTKMSPAQQWTANQKFLDRMISRGDDVILASPAKAAEPGTFFARELEYLRSKGFTLSADGTRMLPPGL